MNKLSSGRNGYYFRRIICLGVGGATVQSVEGVPQSNATRTIAVCVCTTCMYVRNIGIGT